MGVRKDWFTFIVEVNLIEASEFMVVPLLCIDIDNHEKNYCRWWAGKNNLLKIPFDDTVSSSCLFSGGKWPNFRHIEYLEQKEAVWWRDWQVPQPGPTCLFLLFSHFLFIIFCCFIPSLELKTASLFSIFHLYKSKHFPPLTLPSAEAAATSFKWRSLHIWGLIVSQGTEIDFRWEMCEGNWVLGTGMDKVLSISQDNNNDKLGVPFLAEFLDQFYKHCNQNKSLKIVVDIFLMFRLSWQCPRFWSFVCQAWHNTLSGT